MLAKKKKSIVCQSYTIINIHFKILYQKLNNKAQEIVFDNYLKTCVIDNCSNTHIWNDKTSFVRGTYCEMTSKDISQVSKKIK